MASHFRCLELKNLLAGFDNKKYETALAIFSVACYTFDSGVLNSTEEIIMPVITVAIHPISQEEKTDLIKQLTDTAVEVTGISADKYVVFIDEFENSSIGLAGKTRAEIIAGKSV
jgi:4-oxalocrotonate tautomerase family enzyme